MIGRESTVRSVCSVCRYSTLGLSLQGQKKIMFLQWNERKKKEPKYEICPFGRELLVFEKVAIFSSWRACCNAVTKKATSVQVGKFVIGHYCDNECVLYRVRHDVQPLVVSAA